MGLFELGSELGSEMELGSKIVEWKPDVKLELRLGLELFGLDLGLAWTRNWEWH